MVNVQPNIPKNYRNELTYFRAIQAGADFSKEDIIILTEQIDQKNESSLNVVWKNRTTGLILDKKPTIGVDVELLENAKIKLTSETATLKASAVGLNKVPDSANFALVHVIGGDIIYTLDGVTVPKTGALPLGVRVKDWGTFKLEGRDEVVKFQAIPLNKNEKIRLYTEYSQIINDHS
jgi:hypothetical protein